MAEPPGLPDMANPDVGMLTLDDDDPRFNHDAVHEIHRGIRSVLDDYPDAVTIGQIWVFENEDFAKYLRPDELHMGFSFRLARAEFDVTSIRVAIENALAAAATVVGCRCRGRATLPRSAFRRTLTPGCRCRRPLIDGELAPDSAAWIATG
ncbi:hypothetical protein MSAR_47030 [Mycolicibacterium sarraceniae]|uniref:Uncharacterized protein n=1 Tax=Mycolicibacterium sarraceniae TaxID=1534348 RepID=A0A7I7SX33_9MYCO|nr:hypothetical protein MSAR_47030 [Mycolicibacterium sarraceniae]